jgi:hypothetical protein
VVTELLVMEDMTSVFTSFSYCPVRCDASRLNLQKHKTCDLQSYSIFALFRYRFIAYTSVASSKPDAQCCAKLLESADLKNWQIGHSKV